MKQSVYSILKARFLINEDAFKNWRFILFLIGLAIVMIGNTHHYEEKVIRIGSLTNKVKDLRSRFVENRSALMKMKMESSVAAKMAERQIYSASVPPKKIKVIVKKHKPWYNSLWQ